MERLTRAQEEVDGGWRKLLEVTRTHTHGYFPYIHTKKGNQEIHSTFFFARKFHSGGWRGLKKKEKVAQRILSLSPHDVSFMPAIVHPPRKVLHKLFFLFFYKRYSNCLLCSCSAHLSGSRGAEREISQIPYLAHVRNP